MTEEYRNLMNSWAVKHKEETDKEYYEYHQKRKNESGYVPKNNFKFDGIVSDEEYNNSAKKILFVAKECNLREHLDKESFELNDDKFFVKEYYNWKKAGEKTWKNDIFMQGISMMANLLLDSEDNKKIEPNKDYNVLGKIALINLNKRGGYNNCIWKTLEEYTKKYAKEIFNQIKLINPDIIVCCGKSVKWLLEEYVLLDSDMKGIQILDAYHPSYHRISDVEKLKYLKKQIKSVKK